MPISNDDILNAIRGLYNDEPNRVQLTGSNAEKRTLLNREIRTDGGTLNLSAPIGIRSMKVVLIVYGITGTFSESEGYRYRIVKQSLGGRQMYTVVDFDASTTVNNYSGQLVDIVPGIAEKEKMDGGYKSVDDYMSGYDYRFQYYISGTFQSGEGIDCEAWVEYVY